MRKGDRFYHYILGHVLVKKVISTTEMEVCNMYHTHGNWLPVDNTFTLTIPKHPEWKTAPHEEIKCET